MQSPSKQHSEPPILLNRKEIRRDIRATRRLLSDSQQTQAAADVCSHILNKTWFQRASCIALYIANDGELDPHFLLNHSWQQNKKVFLPCLHQRHDKLIFKAYTPSTVMHNNRFKIAEPSVTKHYPWWAINIVFVPLVAFTKTGVRLGMGGGFYDRTLSQPSILGRSTLRIGLAHDCQQMKTLPEESWDQALDAVITPSKIYSCSARMRSLSG